MFLRFLAAFILAFLPALAQAAPPFPITVTDARGARVTVKSEPHKIISLTPGTTEMLFALGLGRYVIGVTTSCDYPPEAKRIAKIGDFSPNIERVIHLQPDLIVGDIGAVGSGVARLTALHQPVLAIHPDSYAAVEQTLVLIGQATGANAAAARQVFLMERKRRQVQALTARDHKRPKALIVVGLNPLFTAGPGTFLDDTVRNAGGINSVPVAGYAAYSKERVLAHPPDVILASPRDQAALLADPVLRTLAAVRAHRFVYVADGNTLLRPGPRLGDALVQVARALHGAK